MRWHGVSLKLFREAAAELSHTAKGLLCRETGVTAGRAKTFTGAHAPQRASVFPWPCVAGFTARRLEVSE